MKIISEREHEKCLDKNSTMCQQVSDFLGSGTISWYAKE